MHRLGACGPLDVMFILALIVVQRRWELLNVVKKHLENKEDFLTTTRNISVRDRILSFGSAIFFF